MSTDWPSGYPLLHEREAHLLANKKEVDFKQEQMPFEFAGVSYKVLTTILTPKIVPVKGTLLLVHGLGGFGAFFSQYCAKDMIEAGFKLIIPDLPHYGRTATKEDFGCIQNMDIYPVCLESLIKRYSPSEPVFLLGLSLGGMHLTSFLADPKRSSLVKGAVYLSPALAIEKEVEPSWLLQQTIRTVLYWVPSMGNFVVPGNKGPQGKVCPDPQFDIDFESDPLNYSAEIKLATGRSLMDTFAVMPDRCKAVSVPILVCHGDADRVCAIQGSRDFIENCPSKDKTLIEYPGCQHILFHEEPKTLKDILAWLKARS